MKNIILALPIMLLVAVSSADAQRGPMWQDEDLNLTDQQQQKMDDLKFQHQKAMIQKNAAPKKQGAPPSKPAFRRSACYFFLF